MGLSAASLNSLDRLRTVMGWAIIVAWTISLALDASIMTYEPPTSIHILMMLAAGALFGPKIIGRNGNNRR
jgi:hypothetical protein